jgi:Fe-S-cluster formation regulator IscX/YfhJ
MSDENTTQSEVPDVKEVVDKIADAAPSVDPRDLDRTDLLAGLNKVDQTILRLNKYVVSL